MADRYLLEQGAPDGFLLEDGSGVLLLEGEAALENTGARRPSWLQHKRFRGRILTITVEAGPPPTTVRARITLLGVGI